MFNKAPYCNRSPQKDSTLGNPLPIVPKGSECTNSMLRAARAPKHECWDVGPPCTKSPLKEGLRAQGLGIVPIKDCKH